MRHKPNKNDVQKSNDCVWQLDVAGVTDSYPSSHVCWFRDEFFVGSLSISAFPLMEHLFVGNTHGQGLMLEMTTYQDESYTHDDAISDSRMLRRSTSDLPHLMVALVPPPVTPAPATPSSPMSSTFGHIYENTFGLAYVNRRNACRCRLKKDSDI